MTRFTLLPLLGFLAACSDPDLMGPSAPETEVVPPAESPVTGVAIQDALDRIVPAVTDQALGTELAAALRGATSDPDAVLRVLVRLEADPSFAADADAIRLAIKR
jgi:hypothetical protein